jgi:hypothetical protein
MRVRIIKPGAWPFVAVSFCSAAAGRFLTDLFLDLLPFRYSLVALGDVCRVFASPESSSRWHSAAGGGIWVAVSASAWAFQVGSSFNAIAVRSDERTAFYLSTGLGL